MKNVGCMKREWRMREVSTFNVSGDWRNGWVRAIQVESSYGEAVGSVPTAFAGTGSATHMVAVRSGTGESIASILGETAKGKAEFGLVRNHSDWFGLVPNFLFKKEFDRKWKVQLGRSLRPD